MGTDTYETRLKRVDDAIALKEPDQIPISAQYQSFPFLWAGYTMAEVNYDVEKAMDAVRRYLLHFQPDFSWGFTSPFAGAMPMMEKIGCTWMEWAGKPGTIVPDRSIFQYKETELMEEDEYDEFFRDPSAWLIQKYLPRVSTVCEPFANMNFWSMMGYGLLPGTMQFLNPQIAMAFQTLHEIAGEYLAYAQKAGQFEQETIEMGFIPAAKATTTAPYDALSDNFRGTIGGLMDIMSQPENVLRATEFLADSCLYGALAQAEHSNGRTVFIPLHKGIDGFMSDEQYKEFYWKSFLKLINQLVDHGLTPYIYTEGKYNTRIKYLKELPPGKCWVHFETADMEVAKKELGDIACLSGGISARVLVDGTKEQVKDAVKKNIDILAPGGGYIFDFADTMEDCNPENVEVLFDTLRTYGKK